MLNTIIDFSIRNKLVVGLFVLSLIAWGGYSITRLNIDAVPDITNNQVQIITSSPSLAAQEIERLVTFPIEQSVATLPELVEVRSFSRFGLSVVTVVFQEDTDLYWARQQISERLQEARNQIPAGVGSPELSPISTGLGEVYQYLVLPKKGYEEKFTPTELRTIQDWIVRRQLLGTPGVADVSSFGGFLKQYEVAVDPDRLKSLGVTIPEVTHALEQNNQNTGGSYITTGPRAYFIRTEGLVNSGDEIGKIVVRTSQSGIPLLIRDVAEVRIGHAVRYGALTYNDQGEAVGGIVMMLKGANSNEVIERVKERMKTIQTSLPEGVEVHAYLDRSELVGRAIDTVTRNLVEGALIVIFVLVLFLGNLRAGLVVASVIPLSMLFAIGLMVAFGVSGNLMSLGAIDFGLVVDGAVIIVEAIMHRFAIGSPQALQTSEQRNGAVFEAASKIRQSAAFGEIIILIVYLPILALVGIEGKMFRPMAQTVTFAILGAFILSLTYVPAMSALVLRPQKAHKPNISDRMIAFLHRLYEPALQFALRAKVLVVGAAVLLLIVSGIMFSRMGGEFIPTLDEGDFAVETRVLLGSSIDHTVEQSLKSAKVLLHQFPEVKEVVGKIGSAEIPTDPMPVEAIDMMVILKDRDEWTSASTREELANKMTEALEVLPGVTYSFLQPIQMRFNELMSGAKQDVVMKIYGEDLGRLSQYADKAGSLVRNIKGAEDVYIEEVQGLPQIVVQYDRNRLAQFGLNVQELNQVVQAAFAGQSAGLVYEQERRFDLVVRMKQEYRNDIESVRNLLVPTPDGHQVPLQQIADVKLLPGINQIQRDDAKRRIMVAFNVRGRDVESVVEELRDKASDIKLAPGYYYTFGGQFENLEQAKARLQIAVPAALLLIFILLYFTFNSVWQALLIFTAVPLSAIGGVLALWLRGMPFSISAGVGFIALFGVAVLNGIVLIGYFNQLKAEGVADIKTRILQGTAVRLRPVLMTATVASLGFLPMALSNTAGAEVQKPLATVVIGGLVSATFLTLFVLPILYSWLERWRGSRLTKRALGILLLFAAPNAFAQQPAPAPTLTLSQALEQAEKNNSSIRAGSLEFDAATAQQKAALDFGRTSFEWMHGQYNSPRTDNSFTISQSLSLPQVYNRRAALARAQAAESEAQLLLTKAAIRQQVKEAYVKLVYAHAYLQQLQRQDSLYTAFARAAELRFRTGETARLEAATAKVEKMRNQSRLDQAQSQIRAAEKQLMYLLALKSGPLLPERKLTKLTLSPAIDTTAIPQGPTTQTAQALANVREAELKAQQTEWAPNFTLGYFNQSLIGYHEAEGTARYYSASDRFTGFQLGISVPLWFRPQSARVQAARLRTEAAKTALERQEALLAASMAVALEQYRQRLRFLQFYEDGALPQAELIAVQASKAYRAGEAGYMEYVQALERTFAIQHEYLEALLQYNLAVIEIEYLLNL